MTDKVIPLGEAHRRRGPIRVEIVDADPAGIPQILIPAQITDHDVLSGNKSASLWPENLAHSTLKLHMHFCELIHAWNINPLKPRDILGVVCVDESAEAQGRSRFSFTSQASLTDFIDHYGLSDFVLDQIHARRSGAFHFLELTNKFHPSEIEEFFQVYASAMTELATIESERRRAIHNDGEKIGHVLIDHFCLRETAELIRIRAAREKLGAGVIAK